jgi:DNA-binding transcriptional regulator YhcF (GntR family)
MQFIPGSYTTIPFEEFNGLPAIEQAILLWLYRYADNKGRSFPSVRLLAIHTDLNKETVVNALKRLVDKGKITRTATPYRSENLVRPDPKLVRFDPKLVRLRRTELKRTKLTKERTSEEILADEGITPLY